MPAHTHKIGAIMPNELLPCLECNGTGIRENSKDQECECIHCDGTGKELTNDPSTKDA